MFGVVRVVVVVVVIDGGGGGAAAGAGAGAGVGVRVGVGVLDSAFMMCLSTAMSELQQCETYVHEASHIKVELLATPLLPVCVQHKAPKKRCH